MASHSLTLSLLFGLSLTALLPRFFAFDISIKTSLSFPFLCSTQLNTCNASLYRASDDFSIEEVASLYSVNTSEVNPFTPQHTGDLLVNVPCTCSSVFGITGYFYAVNFTANPNETYQNVSDKYFNGQAMIFIEEEGKSFRDLTMHLLCGCVESESQVVVTYTVENRDTLSSIATRLSAKLENIESLNRNLTQDPSFVDEGWVLFVPMERNGIQPSKAGKHKWEIILGVLVSVTVISIGALIFVLMRRRKSSEAKNKEKPKGVSKSQRANKSYSLQRQFTIKEDIENVTAIESEKPVEFGLEDIEYATGNFDEDKIIGQGGYGSVYYGLLEEKEVAVKKMRSNKSKEFFAELKVLCKIHHINVVELLGYACGDDHLYLVYEYIQKGSLSDHLHDPSLKGHRPLSWTARTLIALGAAKGIEYIHDYTKARYVHRDIKTSNILLDESLRAKVADFGLAKLVGRANEDDSIATRLVGTPGYLPPESVKELQVTPKTDVFAFGVVLAELITGKRALFRDNREPTKMKSLITIVKNIFQDKDPESALEAEIDGSLRESCPIEAVFKMAEVAESCLSEEAVDRPEMGEIVVVLSQIVTSSTEWEASLGGNSQVFSGVFNGR